MLEKYALGEDVLLGLNGISFMLSNKDNVNFVDTYGEHLTYPENDYCFVVCPTTIFKCLETTIEQGILPHLPKEWFEKAYKMHDIEISNNIKMTTNDKFSYENALDNEAELLGSKKPLDGNDTERLYLEMKDQYHTFELGLSNMLECFMRCVNQEILPKLPASFITAVCSVLQTTKQTKCE